MAFSNLSARPRLLAFPCGWTVDLTILSFIGLFCVFVVQSGRFRTKDAMDYYQFWVVGQAIQKMDVSDIYSPLDRSRVGRFFVKDAVGKSATQIRTARGREVLEPCATPFLYAVFSLFSTGDYDTDYALFFGFSLFAYMAAVFVLARTAGFGPAFGLGFTAYATFFFWPFRRDVVLGNVTQVQLALIAVYFAAVHSAASYPRRAWAGVVLAFSFFFKPTIIYSVVLLVGMWILLEDVQALAWYAAAFLVAGIVAVALPWVSFGGACGWREWLIRAPGMLYKAHWVKDSLPSLLFHTLDRRVHRLLALLCIAGLLFFVWKGRGRLALSGRIAHRLRGSGRREALLLSIGLGVYLLTDPLVHGQYLVLVLPLALLVLAEAHNGEVSPQRTWSIIIGVTAGLFMISTHPVIPWHRSAYFIHLWNYLGTAVITALGAFQFIRISDERLPSLP